MAAIFSLLHFVPAAAADMPSQPNQGAATILLAVGDIADCNYEDAHHEETAALVDTLKGRIAILGDIAYPTGSPEQFAECYDPAWGRHNARARPVPGNHEYGQAGAAGYYSYFGAAASPQQPDCIANCKGYYSYNAGYWHIVALNSEIAMEAGSEQEQWLRADLAANRTRCTLAYWHRPRFSSGIHGGDTRSADVWQALYEVGVDLVLNGHDHHYERSGPQNPGGVTDEERGIRQFIVGTGGAILRTVGPLQANTAAVNDQTWGVLQLALYPDYYEWQFLPVAGQSYTESGRAPCVSVEGDWETKHFLPLLY